MLTLYLSLLIAATASAAPTLKRDAAPAPGSDDIELLKREALAKPEVQPEFVTYSAYKRDPEPVTKPEVEPEFVTYSAYKREPGAPPIPDPAYAVYNKKREEAEETPKPYFDVYEDYDGIRKTKREVGEEEKVPQADFAAYEDYGIPQKKREVAPEFVTYSAYKREEKREVEPEFTTYSVY